MSDEVRLALLEFLTQRYSDMKRRLTRMLGSNELADDALHDTWLRLGSLENQAPVMNPRAFLLRMAVNIAINNLRSQSRAVPSSEIDALLEVADHAPGPEQTIVARSEMEALSKIIESMPQRRRDILLLVRWEGMSQKEVAQRLGISLSSVEHELKRAQDYCAERMSRKK